MDGIYKSLRKVFVDTAAAKKELEVSVVEESMIETNAFGEIMAEPSSEEIMEIEPTEEPSDEDELSSFVASRLQTTVVPLPMPSLEPKEPTAQDVANAEDLAQTIARAKAEAEAQAVVNAEILKQTKLQAQAQIEAQATMNAQILAQTKAKAAADTASQNQTNAEMLAQTIAKAKSQRDAQILANGKIRAQIIALAKAQAEAQALAKDALDGAQNFL